MGGYYSPTTGLEGTKYLHGPTPYAVGVHKGIAGVHLRLSARACRETAWTVFATCLHFRGVCPIGESDPVLWLPLRSHHLDVPFYGPQAGFLRSPPSVSGFLTAGVSALLLGFKISLDLVETHYTRYRVIMCLLQASQAQLACPHRGLHLHLRHR